MIPDAAPRAEAAARRVTAFAVPEQLLDPCQASPGELQRFGLPPRPDALAQPGPRRAWDRAFGQPIRLLPFVRQDDLQARVTYRLHPRRQKAQAVAQTRFESSSNWSGAYVSPTEGRGFVQVWGAWTVPDGLRVPPPPFEGRPWQGLQGGGLDRAGTGSGATSTARCRRSARRPYLSRTARGGRKRGCSGGRATRMSLQLVILPLPVAPGQPVLCVLTVLDAQLVNCVAVNLGTSPVTAQAVSIVPPMAKLNGEGSGTARPSVTGATAEWVVERPRDVDLPRFENFPDYGQTRFDLCLAVQGDAPNVLSLLGGSPMGLEGARDIRMFDVLTGPARTEYISMPKKLNDATLKVRYGGFQ